MVTLFDLEEDDDDDEDDEDDEEEEDEEDEEDDDEPVEVQPKAHAGVSKRARKRAALASAPDGDDGGAAPPASKRKKKATGGADSFRDGEFWMGYEKDEDAATKAERRTDAFLRVHSGDNKAAGRLDDAVMDLVEDEKDGVRKARSVLKWNQKKRKYVRETLGQQGIGATDSIGDRGKKRTRDESGRLIKEKANLYEAWQKSSKRRIQAPGESESQHAAEAMPNKKRFAFGRRWHTATAPLPNAGVRSELKSDAQITKERKVQARKAAKGGGKGGKGGGKPEPKSQEDLDAELDAYKSAAA